MRISFLLLGIFLLLANNAEAQFFRFSGEASLTEQLNKKDGTRYALHNIRYIPELRTGFTFGNYKTIDMEVSLNSYIYFQPGEDSEDNELYRLKLRYLTAQSELRLGKQKISFGYARLIRALMWFDTIDPRDPLGLTAGLYGLSYKYTFLNNSQIWLWGFYQNDNLKPFERYRTDKDKPEFGGRISYPAGDGEFAATFHSRNYLINSKSNREYRFALDGRWEYYLGFWFENSMIYSKTFSPEEEFTRYTTAGSDYTFSLGNGLYVSAEHMNIGIPDFDDFNISALQANYPIGLFSAISLIAYYDWKSEKLSPYLSYRITFDKFYINLSMFKYPEQNLFDQNLSKGMINGVEGFQIIFVYNH